MIFKFFSIFSIYLIFTLFTPAQAASQDVKTWSQSKTTKRQAPSVSTDLSTTQAHSTATLYLDQLSYVPGETLRAGLWIELEEKWHTYWLNPGDSGAPVLFDWSLPPGWSAGEIQFPAPQRISTPPLQTFGFEGKKILVFSEIRMAKETQGPVTLSLDAEWLVCESVCIPAVHTFKITLPQASTKTPSEHFKLFNTLESLLPRISQELEAHLEIADGQALIELKTPPDWTPVDIFPAPESPLSNLQPEMAQDPASRDWLLSTSAKKTKPKNENLNVLVQLTDSQKNVFYQWVQLRGPPTSLLWHLIFAFIGGLILNLMPCVFPLISIKFFSVLEGSHGNTRSFQIANLVYAAGVIVSFLALGLSLHLLRSGGEALGWGFQLQSPGFVVFMILLFTAMAFNFLGWFEINILVPGAGSLLQKDGYVGHFLTGVLSTVLASPCTAPFMGVALGFALSQPLSLMLLIFATLGLGLSFPYLWFCLFPQTLKFLPRPGVWMEKLKTFMAFPLLATVIWLAWLLSFQASATSVSMVWLGVLLMGFSLWTRQHLFQKSRPLLRNGLFLFVLLISIVVSYIFLTPATTGAPPVNDTSGSDLQWQPFSPEKVREWRSQKKAIFVDFTAAWCITCQVNKKVTFPDERVINFIKTNDIQMLVADWTNRNPVITQTLSEYGRVGVPFYLYFPADPQKKPVILPEVLTPSIFIDNIKPYL